MKLLYRLSNTKFAVLLFISFFYLVHLSNLCFAFNDSNIAGLEINLSNMKDDTVKVNALIALGKHYCSVKNDQALIYLQEAHTIASVLNYGEGIGKSLFWQGRVFYYKDDYPISNKYYEKSENYLKNNTDLDALAFLYFAKGENFRITGDYIQAMESYKLALELAEKTGNKKYKATFYGSIGMVLLNRNEPKRAMCYFKESLKQNKLIDNPSNLSNTYTSIGLAFDKLNNLDSSLWYYNQALEIRVEHNFERAIASSEYNRAGIYNKMGLYEKAEKSAFRSREIFNNFEEKTGVIISSLRLAEARNMLDKPDAIELAESSLAMAIEINNPSLISHSYKVLSEIYYSRGEYKLSYDYLTHHKILDDSIFSTEKERFLTEFEEKFQSERKDSEIAYYKSKTRIQKQNNILLIVFLIAVIGFAFLLFFLFRLKSITVKRQKQLINQENLIHSQENKLVEKENQILQEQLESKNRELASKALEMIRLNDTISQIIEKLELFKKSTNNPEVSRHIREVILELENQTKQNIWSEFEKIFKNIHTDFYKRLLELCPDLSSAEIKTAALLKLNLTTKEIAALTFKSEGGIKTTRYRLRKKLNLSNDDKLVPYLMQI